MEEWYKVFHLFPWTYARCLNFCWKDGNNSFRRTIYFSKGQVKLTTVSASSYRTSSVKKLGLDRMTMIPILCAVQQSCFITNQDNLNQGKAGFNKSECSGSQQPNLLSTHSFLGVCITVGQYEQGFLIFFMSLGHMILHFGTSSPIIMWGITQLISGPEWT